MGKKIAVDTHYFSNTEAKTVGFIFDRWEDPVPRQIIEVWSTEFGPYISGEFYKRELPCIMDLLRTVPDLNTFDAIILDGLAHLPCKEGDDSKVEGLGIHLETALIEEGIIERDTDSGVNHPGIIGVAKTEFKGCKEDNGTSKVFRGKSKTPLYVNTTWFGYSSASAAECIKSMHGDGKIPTLLRDLDKLTKTR